MTLLWMSLECGSGENGPTMPLIVVVQGPRNVYTNSM